MTRLIKDRFGKWYKDTYFNTFAHIYESKVSTEVSLEKPFMKSGLITEIVEFEEEPSVIDYLKHDMRMEAIFRYYQLHNCSHKEAIRMVDKIQEDMYKLSSEYQLF